MSTRDEDFSVLCVMHSAELIGVYMRRMREDGARCVDSDTTNSDTNLPYYTPAEATEVLGRRAAGR